MATYKRGFHRQTPDQVLLKAIVIIILSVFAIVAFALIYDALTTTREYTDYTAIEDYSDIYNQLDSGVLVPEYLVYFYSDTCTSCQSVKQEALKLVDKAEKAGIPVYFVDIANATDTDGAKAAFLLDIDESSLKTPMIVSIVNGEYVDKFIGTDAVLQILTDTYQGDYAPFN